MFSICITKGNPEDRNVLFRYALQAYCINRIDGVPHLNLDNSEKLRLCGVIQTLRNTIKLDEVISIYLCENSPLGELVGVLSPEEICEESLADVYHGISNAKLSVT